MNPYVKIDHGFNINFIKSASIVKKPIKLKFSRANKKVNVLKKKGTINKTMLMIISF
jgi:hypothetical protein